VDAAVEFLIADPADDPADEDAEQRKDQQHDSAEQDASPSLLAFDIFNGSQWKSL
jgi:hypothetical protein